MPSPSDTTLLLIQARAPGDPMLDHEASCIRRRLGDRAVRLNPRNALDGAVGIDALDGMAGVVIGGSGDFSVEHPVSHPWVEPLVALVEEVLRRGMPGFGICFGHQLLGRVHGAALLTDHARREGGTIGLELTAAGRADPVFGPLKGAFAAHTGHTDRVAEVPAGLELLASGDVVETQAFRTVGGTFYSTQFHPDLTGAEAGARYAAYRAALEGKVAPASNSESSAEAGGHFRPGEDATTELLGRFVDELVRGPG